MLAIDSSAKIAPSSVIGTDVEIGPYCVVGPNVAIGDGCKLIAQVHVTGHTTIGAGNPNASPDAAVERATHDVLVATLPTQSAELSTA